MKKPSSGALTTQVRQKLKIDCKNNTRLFIRDLSNPDSGFLIRLPIPDIYNINAMNLLNIPKFRICLFVLQRTSFTTETLISSAAFLIREPISDLRGGLGQSLRVQSRPEFSTSSSFVAPSPPSSCLTFEERQTTRALLLFFSKKFFKYKKSKKGRKRRTV